MEAQANTTREQSKKNNIGWRPSHGDNGGVGKKKKKFIYFKLYWTFLMEKPQKNCGICLIRGPN